MIIDSHAHLVTPMSVWGLRTMLQASGGQHSVEWLKTYLSPADLEQAIVHNLTTMDGFGTDVQILSPRPFTLMHSHPRFSDVNAWIQIQNDLIHDVVSRHPTRFRGMAGLPQVLGKPIEITFDEIDRCIDELGFVGILLNPDPSEGAGTSPPLGDPYWTPLWEKMVSLDIPALVHSAGCCGRETYDEHFSSEESLAITSIAHSDVFAKFPDIKLIIAHGGGSIPYQIGRWRGHWLTTQAAKKPHLAAYFKALQKAAAAKLPLPPPPEDLETFDDVLKRFYFDTVVHDRGSLEHLIRKVGADRCLFGTERPGGIGAIDLATGHPMDDFRYTIDHIAFLDEAERAAIYHRNAHKVFPRLAKTMPAAVE